MAAPSPRLHPDLLLRSSSTIKSTENLVCSALWEPRSDWELTALFFCGPGTVSPSAPGLESDDLGAGEREEVRSRVELVAADAPEGGAHDDDDAPKVFEKMLQWPQSAFPPIYVTLACYSVSDSFGEIRTQLQEIRTRSGFMLVLDPIPWQFEDQSIGRSEDQYWFVP